jgi:hypothetical protein
VFTGPGCGPDVQLNTIKALYLNLTLTDSPCGSATTGELTCPETQSDMPKSHSLLKDPGLNPYSV